MLHLGRSRHQHRNRHHFHGNTTYSLADVRPGHEAQVTNFSDELSPDRRFYLQSYGLIPGQVVHVVQQSPVTVIQIENLELALEGTLARRVHVRAS